VKLESLSNIALGGWSAEAQVLVEFHRGAGQSVQENKLCFFSSRTS
jgi:hypothetical protein